MKNIAVLTENHPGVIADITQLLGDQQVNILTLDVDGVESHGVIQLTVDQYDQALQTLKAAGYRAISEDALVIRITDEPGALAKIASRFKTHAINIRSMHILDRKSDYVLVSIVTDDNKNAEQWLQDVLVSN